MAGHSLSCIFLREFRDQRFGLLFLVADELLDSVQGPLTAQLPGGATEDALQVVLGADDRSGLAGGSAVVSVGAQRGGPPRHPGLDVFLDDVLDVVRPLRSFEFM